MEFIIAKMHQGSQTKKSVVVYLPVDIKIHNPKFGVVHRVMRIAVEKCLLFIRNSNVLAFRF